MFNYRPNMNEYKVLTLLSIVKGIKINLKQSTKLIVNNNGRHSGGKNVSITKMFRNRSSFMELIRKDSCIVISFKID